MTYAEAADKCAAEGLREGLRYRLCNKNELLEDICCGTGGQCDDYGVWTSTGNVISLIIMQADKLTV